MITIKEVIEKSEFFLKEKGVLNPRRQAEDVISFCLLKPRLELYTHFDSPLNEKELQIIRKNLLRRASKEPIQYIEGRVEFFNTKLFVSPDVLIPRQETEILVDKMIEKLKLEPVDGKIFWDVGTGSGAIAISIKKMFPALHVFASDFCEKAFKVAQKNAENNDAEITFLRGDLLSPFGEQKADYICSNPPYIPEDEYPELEEEVRRFEPKTSLVGGKTGFEFYIRFAKEIRNYLKPKGKAFFEIGYNQGEKVKEIFKKEGFDKVYFEKDFSSNDRFFFLELE